MKGMAISNRLTLAALIGLAVGLFGGISITSLNNSASAATSPITLYSSAEHELLRNQTLETCYLLHRYWLYEDDRSSQAGPQLGKPLTSYNEAEITAYRWQAMANFYKHHGSAGIR